MDVIFPNGNFERLVEAEDRVVRRWLRKFIRGRRGQGCIAVVQIRSQVVDVGRWCAVE